MITRREILGPDGRPLGVQDGVVAKSLLGTLSSYAQSLANVRMPAMLRAQDPFTNHPWVFAAGVTLAQTAAQAPFVVMRDQQKTTRAGWARRAQLRRAMMSPVTRAINSEGEILYDHPVAQLLSNPNPYQDASQLFQMTYLWLHVRGEVFWVILEEEGTRTIWPLSPELFVPILKNNTWGELVGWRFTPPPWTPIGNQRFVELDLDEVIQFKTANPTDLTRGLSRLSPVAGSIESDMLSRTHSANLLRNSAVPKGLITYDGAMSPEEEREFKEKWRQRYEGVENAAKTALLSSGFKYQSLTMNAQDLSLMEREDANKKEILGVMSTPPSVVGITEFTNYATALAQDKSYWEKTVLPAMRIVESSLDRSIFFTETDDVYGMHDLRGIEALRVGLDAKIDLAKKLVDGSLHMSPRLAYEVVGLEIPRYEGDDVCLVTPTLGPVSGVLEPPAPMPAPAPARPSQPVLTRSKAAKRTDAGRSFLKAQATLEKQAIRAYSRWIRRIASDTMDRFDKETRRFKAQKVDLSAVVPDLTALRSSMKDAARPMLYDGLEVAYDSVLDVLGIPIFSLDDPLLQAYLDAREEKLVQLAPETLVRNVRAALEASAKAGETIGQIRDRLANVFRASTSPARALTWARTETAGLINGARETMYGLSGVEKHSWSNAQDEHVRADHVRFGNLGPKALDFDYLSVIDRTDGRLTHPGDIQGPADQVINCRCTSIPED